MNPFIETTTQFDRWLWYTLSFKLHKHLRIYYQSTTSHKCPLLADQTSHYHFISKANRHGDVRGKRMPDVAARAPKRVSQRNRPVPHRRLMMLTSRSGNWSRRSMRWENPVPLNASSYNTKAKKLQTMCARLGQKNSKLTCDNTKCSQSCRTWKNCWRLSTRRAPSRRGGGWWAMAEWQQLSLHAKCCRVDFRQLRRRQMNCSKFQNTNPDITTDHTKKRKKKKRKNNVEKNNIKK